MYHLYGDESRSEGIVVYGIVICPEASVPILNQTIDSVKSRYGVSSSARFHCRELFNGDSRRKTAWKHLTERQAYQAALDLTSSLGGKGLKTTLGIIDTSILGKEILPVGTSKSNFLKHEKQLTPFAFQAAAGPLLMNPEFQGRMKLWVDPDDTNIPWWGKNIKADRTLSIGMLDHIQLKRSNVLLPQNIEDKQRPLGLEAADLLAYSGARALAKQGRKYDYVFEEILRLIGPTQYPWIWENSSFG